MQGISFKGWYSIPTNNGAFDQKTRKFMIETLPLRNTENDAFNNKTTYYVSIKNGYGRAFEKTAVSYDINGCKKVSDAEIFGQTIKLPRKGSLANKITMNLYKQIKRGIKHKMYRQDNTQIVSIEYGVNAGTVFEFDRGVLSQKSYSKDGLNITESFDRYTGSREKTVFAKGNKTICERFYDLKTNKCVKKVIYNEDMKKCDPDDIWDTKVFEYDPKTGELVHNYKTPLFTA